MRTPLLFWLACFSDSVGRDLSGPSQGVRGVTKHDQVLFVCSDVIAWRQNITLTITALTPQAQSALRADITRVCERRTVSSA